MSSLLRPRAITRAYIVENEITYLAFPLPPMPS